MLEGCTLTVSWRRSFQNLSISGVEHSVQSDLTDLGIRFMFCIPLHFFVVTGAQYLFSQFACLNSSDKR